MAAPVFVLGGWQSDFSERAGPEGLFDLMSRSVLSALEEASVAPEEVQVAHVGNLAGELFCGQAHLGGMVASIHPAFNGLPTSRHEAACASGSIATLAAMADIESGRYDVALVTGVEVQRNVSGQKAGELLGCAAWVGRELADEQFPWPSQFALVAEEYEGRWGLRHDHLARIAEVNFGNARRNPNAQTRDWTPPTSYGEDDQENPVVRGMLRKQDCGRITDGAAAVVLANADFVRDWATRTGRDADEVPRIAGWGHHTAPLSLEEKLRANVNAPYLFPHLQQTVADALRRAGVPDIFGVDALEVHDCFSISEYVAIDHAGITAPGASWQAVEDDVIGPKGKLPVNPSGGLLGLGHPVGATGVRMLLDSYKQVSGTAGEYQVDGAKRAATLNIGGSFTTAVSFVVSA
ncbi:MAG: acetyl-CoA C-acetyltransferase [Acidimicrobiaceae bacterium]|jgi:acetyl-CoA C-acetyltransferase|nr:acetyl-CoA C-acetyltransferase [Acidimicrobiaceae bacterium]